MHTRLDGIYRISIILKGLDAALEIISGSFLFFVTPLDIKRLVNRLTAGELKTNPHDFITTLLAHSAHHLSGDTTTFVAIYLLLHGAIKMFVIINVLRHKYWAYPTLIIVLLAFNGYQVFQIIHDHSIGLILLSIFDLFVIVMTWVEWMKQRALHHHEEVHPEI